MLLLLKLSRRVCDKGDIEFNIEKYKYVVFGKKKFDNTIFLNSILISFPYGLKYQVLEYNSI